jgi:hypothetical protein
MRTGDIAVIDPDNTLHIGARRTPAVDVLHTLAEPAE